MNKAEIAAVLNDIATLLELKGENPFKVRAYSGGARIIETISEEEIGQRVGAGTLQEVKGIGEALAQKISELYATGKLEFYEKLKASLPPGLVELLEIPGVGPKKIKALREQLGVDSIEKLAEACTAGKVAALAGFGEKTQAKILEGIANREAYGRRHHWFEAFATAEPILAGLRELPHVVEAEHAGSLRRRMETVGDLDFLVATNDPQPVVDWFVRWPEVKEITAQGETKASVRLQSGIQADLRLVPPEQFVFALHHFTGSKDHNVQMRSRALGRGLSMSEWGLVPAAGEGTVKQKVGLAGERPPQGARSREQGEGGAAAPNGPKAMPASRSRSIPKLPAPCSSLPAIQTEAQLFEALGLPFIPPELREGLGEIEFAEKNPLPVLVAERDIRGAFHNHTTESDGHNTLEEMVAAAQELGFDYLGIADHSKSSVQASGLDETRLLAQVEKIRALNASRRFTTHVFSGTECDILPDGRLDFADEVLAQLDYVVVAIHSAFRQSREEMTKRIIRALENPHATMLAHPTGRLLLERPGYDIDFEQVIDAAIAHGVIIEINSSPWRLDLDWRHWRRAAERGLLCSINPDAHATGQLDNFRAGVAVARKGWLTRENILTTRSLAEVQDYLVRRKDRPQA